MGRKTMKYNTGQKRKHSLWPALVFINNQSNFYFVFYNSYVFNLSKKLIMLYEKIIQTPLGNTLQNNKLELTNKQKYSHKCSISRLTNASLFTCLLHFYVDKRSVMKFCIHVARGTEKDKGYLSSKRNVCRYCPRGIES